MKHNPTATANALATTTGIFYLGCRVLVSLAPDLMFTIAQSWFHGIELTKLGSWNLSMGTFIAGLISLMVFAWVTGYIFATMFNFFSKK